uniref:FUN14 domain containing 1 n=1 Tax=Pavo cristatus TaxID=9049 RepID=A0A8C9FMD0_PAVCR
EESSSPPPVDDDSYEVLDLTEYARRHHWWNRLFGRNSGPIVEKYSVATQIVMGGVTGWCAGFLFQKVGKLAATAVGGGFLLLQVCRISCFISWQIQSINNSFFLFLPAQPWRVSEKPIALLLAPLVAMAIRSSC